MPKSIQPLWLGSFLITYPTCSLLSNPLCEKTDDFYETTNYGNNAFHIDRYDCITITYLLWMNARVTSATPLWCMARDIAYFRVRLYFKGGPIDRRHICLTRIMYCFMGSFLCLATRMCFNTLRPRQNGRHFADDTFKCIFLNENFWI